MYTYTCTLHTFIGIRDVNFPFWGKATPRCCPDGAEQQTQNESNKQTDWQRRSDLERGLDLLLFRSKDRLSRVHSYANGFIPQKGGSFIRARIWRKCCQIHTRAQANTHTHTRARTAKHVTSTQTKRRRWWGFSLYLFHEFMCHSVESDKRGLWLLFVGEQYKGNTSRGHKSGEPALI